MTKRILALCLCLMLAMCMPGFAQMASQGYSLEGLERYSSFIADEESGEWSVSDPLYAAVQDAVAAGEVKNAAKDGLAVYQLRLCGNEKTGTLRPEIEIHYIARNPIGVQAVSIFTGGARYDFAAKGVSAQFGGQRAEQIVLPVDDMAVLKAIAGAEELELILHGASDIYRTKLSLSAEAKNAKAALEQLSLRCNALIGELEALNAGSYRLWDLSRAEWEAALGFAPACTVSEAQEASMLAFGDKGDAVEQLQALLAQAGFFAGAEEKEYGAKTAAAVARAQEYFGLIVTGSADGALIGCLQGETAPVREKTEAEVELTALGDAAIGVDRWWIAQKVNASASSAALICPDKGNVFAVCEGRIENRGGSEISLGWTITGELVVNGSIRYACTLRAESDAGEGFGSSLLPLAASRLIVAAELPQGVLENASSAVLVLSDGTNSMEYTLIG
ncbi:MAG: peptidoglycan-binding protein [Clostridia bacterium]|nr:peptidoglycan-binding protein [Clostridia bacterium]MBQ4086332.1 peptidoglycan-binding protein [Clostridia bacterium]